MPLPIALAHRMARRLAEVRKSGQLPYLRPDGKTQVTVEYEHGVPARVRTVVVSAQHDPDVRAERLRQRHRRDGHPADDPAPSCASTDPVMHVNPTGRFVTGGPMGDAGPDRSQDHRRQLRRHGPPRRRRVLGQGSDEGRPVGGVRRTLGRQERRRRRPGRPLRDRDRLRHRDRPADLAQRSSRSGPAGSTTPRSRS